MKNEKERKYIQSREIRVESTEDQRDPGDALLRHDFDITQGKPSIASATSKRAIIELVKGWQPIPKLKDLVVNFLEQMRARAFPPLMEIQSGSEDGDEGEDIDASL